MPETFDNAEYREWAPGEWEKRLPGARSFGEPKNKLERIERCALQIKAGAHRETCRQLIYTEEEFENACRMANKEPGFGWFTRPGGIPKPVIIPKPVVEQSELTQTEFPDISF